MTEPQSSLSLAVINGWAPDPPIFLSTRVRITPPIPAAFVILTVPLNTTRAFAHAWHVQVRDGQHDAMGARYLLTRVHQLTADGPSRLRAARLLGVRYADAQQLAFLEPYKGGQLVCCPAETVPALLARLEREHDD